MNDERTPPINVNLPDDGIQHGIDDDPNNDAIKGAITGGIGTAAMGAIAGSMMGPLGAAAGALIGGAVGAAASAAAVAAIDRHDNDNNITGLSDEIAYDRDLDVDDDDDVVDTTYDTATYSGTGTVYPTSTPAGAMGAAPMGAVTDPLNTRDSYFDSRDRVTPDYTTSAGGNTLLLDGDVDQDLNRTRPLGIGNDIPGVQTGGTAWDGTQDTRGVTEKAADAITGDRIDDKTGKVVR